jgi:citrate lyase subunit beta/citryl-CoA lyase
MEPVAMPVVALFVPGDRPDRFARAAASADAAILDLEDAVAAAKKDVARDRVREALEGGLHCWVRINEPATTAGIADLGALARTPPAAILVPKASRAVDIDAVRRAANVPIVALIESVAGFAAIGEIASSGVAALAFGAYDFCAELGARPVPEVLAPWRARVVFAARAAGIGAIDTPFAALEDPAGLARDAVAAVDFGFDGKLAVHPNQVAPIRGAFAPTPAELLWARGVVEVAEGGGVRRFEGSMVDAPLVRAARRILSRAPGPRSQ